MHSACNVKNKEKIQLLERATIRIISYNRHIASIQKKHDSNSSNQIITNSRIITLTHKMTMKERLSMTGLNIINFKLLIEKKFVKFFSWKNVFKYCIN